jgi:threonine dehydrogenase-like Zn-dependent dehydrogenase
MVSSGTELRILSGGDVTPDHPYPLTPGYSVVGEIVQVGRNVRDFKVGDCVSGRNPDRGPEGVSLLYGAHAGYNIYTHNGYCQPILLPDGAKPLDYVIAEIAAISWRGVWMSEPRACDTVVVIGQGLIGALSGAWFASLGCRVIAVDVADNRLERSLAWGVAQTINPRRCDPIAHIAAACPMGPDIVVEASASMPGLSMAYKIIRGRKAYSAAGLNPPRLVLQATYMEETPVHPTGFFDGELIHIIAPQDRTPQDRIHAVESLRRGLITSSDFIDSVTSFDRAPSVYAKLRDSKESIFSAVFDWSSAT